MSSLSRRQALAVLAGAPLAMSAPPVRGSKVEAEANLARALGAAFADAEQALRHRRLDGAASHALDAIDFFREDAMRSQDPLHAFLADAIGRPWSVRENCWTLTARIQRDFFGRRLPLCPLPRTDLERHSAFHTNPNRANWRCIAEPAHGAVVLMSAAESPRVDRHAGVCVMMPAPMIAHVDDPHGVVLDDLSILRARGWWPTCWVPV